MIRLLLAFAVLTLHFIETTPAHANFVVNGDFEAVELPPPAFPYEYLSGDVAYYVPGWTDSGFRTIIWHTGYEDATGKVPVAGSGKQFVTLGGVSQGVGTASFEQLILGLTPGQTYVLKFDQASQSNGVFGLNLTGQDITVDFLSGSPTTPKTFHSPPSTANYWQSWQENTMTFLAASNSVALRFSATVAEGVGLDDVRVESAVPEPSTLVMSSILLVVFGAMHSFKRMKNAGP